MKAAVSFPGVMITSLPLKKTRSSIGADHGSGSTRPILNSPQWMPPLLPAINQIRTKVNPPRDMPPHPWKVLPHETCHPHDAPPPSDMATPMMDHPPLMCHLPMMHHPQWHATPCSAVYRDGGSEVDRPTLAFGAKSLVLRFRDVFARLNTVSGQFRTAPHPFSKNPPH